MYFSLKNDKFALVQINLYPIHILFILCVQNQNSNF